MPKEWWSQWISLSDMMTWLMLIFLLISVLAISEVNKKKEEEKRILIEYNNTKEDIYKELKYAFLEKEKEWNFTISEDLVVKFNNDSILFQANSEILKDEFKIILDEFIPKYFWILNQEKYKKQINEIFIEWHAWKCKDYLDCINISQNRANEVLKYIFQSNYYNNLSENDKKNLEFSLTSWGFSNGRILNSEWNSFLRNGWEINYDISRRVEFRISTKSDELIEKLLNKNNIK